MESKNHTERRVTVKNWYQLGFSIMLAFMLALILSFVPITISTTVWLPELASSQLKPIDLTFPFGVSRVSATGGLTITKSAPSEVDQGQTLTYTLLITNHTNSDIIDGLVADEFSSEVSCGQVIKRPTNWDFDCPGDGIAFGFSETSNSEIITDGATIEIIYTVNVASPLTAGHKIVNDDYQILAFNPGGSDPDPPPVTTTVRAPMWAITKTVSSDTIQPNEFLTYTITITNNGSAATSGTYTVIDVIPTNTISTSADGRIQPPGTRNGNTITWVFTDSDSLPAFGGTKSLTYAVQVASPLAPGTQIVNDGYTVSGGGAFSSAISNSITSTVESSGILNISKIDGLDPVKIGETLIYTLIVTNGAGATGPAQNVVVTDTLPTEVSYQSAGFLGTGDGNVTTPSASTVVWEVTNPASLNVGESVKLTVAVTVDGFTLPDPPLITNTYQASADNAPIVNGTPIGTEVEVGDPTTIIVTADATSLNLCESTLITTSVQDNWTNPIPNIRLQLFIDTSFPPPPSTPYGNATITSTTFVTSNTKGEANGYVQGTAAGNVSAGAVVLPSGAVGQSGNISFTNPAIPTNIDVTVSPSSVVTGSTATATSTVSSCAGPVSGQVVTFTIPAAFGSVNPLTATTDSNGEASTTVTAGNTVGTTSITGSTDTLQDAASFTVQATVAPVLTITKISDPANGSSVNSEGTITYTIRVTNTGAGTATNVLLTDTLPVSVNYISLISSTNGSGAISGPSFPGSNAVALSVTQLETDEYFAATIEVTVTSIISGDLLNNIAYAKSNAHSLISSNIVAHTVFTSTSSSGNDIYLPIVLKNHS